MIVAVGIILVLAAILFMNMPKVGPDIAEQQLIQDWEEILESQCLMYKKKHGGISTDEQARLDELLSDESLLRHARGLTVKQMRDGGLDVRSVSYIDKLRRKAE